MDSVWVVTWRAGEWDDKEFALIGVFKSLDSAKAGIEANALECGYTLHELIKDAPRGYTQPFDENMGSYTRVEHGYYIVDEITPQ